MKTINIHFEDKEHEILSKMKGDMSWRAFLLDGIDYKKEM